MADPYLGELRVVTFNFAPIGWAMCNGQLINISQNTALFSLLGTYYGGDGRSNFALPDLRGRVMIHTGQDTFGNVYDIGESAGATSVSLTAAQLPSHVHNLQATTQQAANTVPTLKYLAAAPPTVGNVYGPGASGQAMAAASVANEGNSAGHPNLMPYLVLNVIIALTGVFPERN